MAFAYPSQRLQDWLSQQWCIFTGRRVEPAEIGWLMGPYGHVDIIEDRYVEQLAAGEGLLVKKNQEGFGLLDSITVLSLTDDDAARLRPEVVDFYEHTLDYEFEVWSHWRGFFRPFAGLVTRLYSRRLQQLNLPLHPMDTSRGIRSQIYKLVDPQSGDARYTIWYRHGKATKQVLYSGIYTWCQLPSGPVCLKVVFPLPRGNATVVMRVEVLEDGSLKLTSQGRRFGDAGFYFLLQDSQGRHWSRYLPSFTESIRVYVDEEKVLRADHEMCVWGKQALHLHYKMTRLPMPLAAVSS